MTDQLDKLWDQTTDNQIIQNCVFADIELTHEIDEIPGQSDQFFDVSTSNLQRLKEEVKEEIVSIISREDT